MITKCLSFLRRAFKDQRGQTITWVAAAFIPLMGMAGLTVDVGYGFVAYNQLQLATNAAALAGAGTLPSTSALSVAGTYGPGTGDNNANSLLAGATSVPTLECLTTLTNQGLPCVAPADANAVQVTSTLSAPTFFMRALGINSMNLKATATAAMGGGTFKSYNIAIVEDTTASMSGSDSGNNCSGTQISCALEGLRTALLLMSPCAVNTTCQQSSGDPQMVNGAVDSVSLFVFPAVTVATESKDTVCPTSNPTIVPYTFSNVTSGSPNWNLPTTATYQVVGFSSDYKTSDSASSLNPDSELVIAAGGGTCSGVKSPGGEGTYYAQVIYAAQAALVAQSAGTTAQNLMLILSDGNATADASSGQIKATTGTLNGTGSNHNVTYPSALGQCGQAVQAAADAAAAGTQVYTFGYGTQKSGGCGSDATYSASITTGGGTWHAGDQPCQAMLAMASLPQNFYSDQGQGCVPPYNVSFTNLRQMFQAWASGLTRARLIPNTTT